MNTGSSKTRILCIFCNERGPRAREDIIPKWYANEFGGTPPFLADHWTYEQGNLIRRRPTRTMGSLAALKLPDICETCNCGWMSGLEDHTKDILLPLMQGSNRVLNFAAQRQISTWVQLKALTLDAWYRKDRRLPASLAHDFYGRLQPLPYGPVSLGNYESFPIGVGVPYGRRYVTPTTGLSLPVKLLRCSLAFKHLFVQSTFGWVEDTKQPSPPPTLPPVQFLIHVWPPDLRQNGNVLWPPPSMISRDHFERLS